MTDWKQWPESGQRSRPVTKNDNLTWVDIVTLAALAVALISDAAQRAAVEPSCERRALDDDCRSDLG